jgi:hypothetical protein
MKTWRREGIGPPFLTSVSDGGEWSPSRPGRFSPREKVSRYPSDRRLSGPQTLWSREKFLASTGNLTPAVQLVYRRYTDWATTALIYNRVCMYIYIYIYIYIVGSGGGARGSVIGWGAMLQAGRSRVQFPIRSLDFSSYLILPAALWP